MQIPGTTRSIIFILLARHSTGALKILWALTIVLLLAVGSCLLPAGAQHPDTPKRGARSCKPGYDDSIGKKKSNPPKRRDSALAIASVPSCIEVHEAALTAQEYLQSFIRDHRWNIGDEQASEELWNFTVYLGADDVAAFTKPLVDPKINWTGGKAIVSVRTIELPDGFTRIVVQARFDGYGEPEDKFAPKRTSWPLASSGVLESRLTTAAESRFSPVH